MNDINPVEYGKLVQSVDNLERKVDAMDKNIADCLAVKNKYPKAQP
jgi:hypothetical protein